MHSCAWQHIQATVLLVLGYSTPTIIYNVPLRAQKFRMAGTTNKKRAAQREEQRQMERRARYGAKAVTGERVKP